MKTPELRKRALAAANELIKRGSRIFVRLRKNRSPQTIPIYNEILCQKPTSHWTFDSAILNAFSASSRVR
jgi:hypothetical protein